LFSYRYLHCSKRCVEFTFFALLNFPALTSHNGHNGSQRPPSKSSRCSWCSFVSFV
jgi:hypothetical protein